MSSVRAANVAVSNYRPLCGTTRLLGMPLYGCATPDGYKDVADKWLSPDATMVRAAFAVALANGNLPLGGDPPAEEVAMQPAAGNDAADPPVKHTPVDAAALEMLIGPVLSANTRTVVAEAPEAQRAALLLGSPEFMHR